MVNLGPFDRDNFSSLLLPEPWSQGYYAARSTGNGNCLFNSCSIALCGNESLAASLRHAVSEELQNNPSRYNQDHPLIRKVVQKQADAVTVFQTVLSNTDDEYVHVTLDNIADLIQSEGFRTREDKRWSTILHVMALSTVLGRTIQSLYPDIPWNYRELYHSNISPASEQSFFSPQICDASSTPIVLLWTRDGDLSQTDHMFTANHVVPIFETEIMQDVSNIVHFGLKTSQMSRFSLHVSKQFPEGGMPNDPPSSFAPSALAGLQHLEKTTLKSPTTALYYQNMMQRTIYQRDNPVNSLDETAVDSNIASRSTRNEESNMSDIEVTESDIDEIEDITTAITMCRKYKVVYTNLNIHDVSSMRMLLKRSLLCEGTTRADGDHDRGNQVLKCVSFDQDCFHDVRKVCADVRQTKWKSEYVPELADLPSDKYVSVYEGKLFTDSDRRELLKVMGSMNGVDHEVLEKLSVHDVVLLGSTQDGLYLEKGFQVFDKGVTDVNASDVDILYVYGGINVIKESIGNGNGLWLTPRETQYPGYFKMQIMAKSFEKHEPFYLKNTHVKMKLLFELGICQHYVLASSLIDVFNSASIVGNSEDEHGILYIDNVAALRMFEWPDIAHEFTNRDRQHGWPAPSLIEHVTSRGCGFVAKGHNESEEFEYQWRISFAESEKILSRSLNPAQIRAYLFFKTLFKTHLEDEDEPGGLSSYMMKTILFWTIESVDGRIWADENMLNCVEILLDRLAMSLDRGVISSFFAPTLNLIGSLDREKGSILANKVKSLTRDLFSSIVTCVESPTFNGMCNTGIPLQQMYKLQDPTEFGALLSMIHFTSYLYLRLQVLMYQQKISVSALTSALEQSCRSVCSVIAPRAVWYLLESIKLQPNTSWFSIRKDSDESYTLDVSVMRRHVVDFWRSANYSGLFTSVIKDQEIIAGDAVHAIPEFDEFIEWVNTTCLWSGAHPVSRHTEKYPPNLD